MKQVVAALIVREDEILVCQRGENHPMPLKWEFPGGKIEPDERPAEALRRELEEELGIDAVIGPLVHSLQFTYANGNAVELRFFAVREFTGEIENRIFNDVRWARRAELPAYDFLEADRELVSHIADGKIV